ncbi:Beta-N-acetylhexosaminidase [Purpureocillium takamizusanense]|uniref:beta-N-acetylhexosaminidase n=1 Tax=Purpureocillium takamizusanense TaxID=2060973 RepID=A0A9Q8VG48_9HYPO|nr:Beta-N-acetylhexosaminidase [Purpureocillium takamizusanense]UNI24258.1 Beta-N-acetylhexosaminidase [Purpureocillium takamizusanense]
MRASLAAGLIAITSVVNGCFLTIPTIPFNCKHGQFSLQHVKSIVLDARHAQAVDKTGQTLIPPTLEDFTRTFKEDLKSSLGIDVPVVRDTRPAPNSIFVTIDDDGSQFKDAAGRHTAEGYRLSVNADGITIAGASALGAWWGTRSVLQTAALNDKNVAHGEGVDAPGWAYRGIMLDGGRHFYPPDFIVEMCAYLSFFKQNTLQLHMSDNLNNYPQRYSRERTMSLYSAFRPWSDDPAVAGLNDRRNESYTRDELDDLQRRCARRGVTVVPEIEAPGHALAIVKWRNQIGLEDLSMLNITHPDTIPTMKTIWKTFLPWFHSKVVHIGADEYDEALVADYTYFVNEMASFIKEESGKDMRIWGTFTPKQGANVSKDVVIQHWSSRMDNALFDFVNNGYQVLNADNSFYVVNKYSASYPPPLKKSQAFKGGNPATGGPFSPNIFDVKNATNNPPRDSAAVQGHLVALWNDWGPNGTTVLEAYRTLRDVPALGDKQWGGELTEDQYDGIIDALRAVVPGQNLERTVPSKTDVVLDYRFSNCGKDSTFVRDRSGNDYHGRIHGEGCKINGSTLSFSGRCHIETPLKSKGRDYTLSFSVKPSSANKEGTLFTGPDSTLLSASADAAGNVTMVSGGEHYALNYSLPVDTWTSVSLVGKGNRTFLSVLSGREPQKMEFLTRLGIWGQRFVWAPMAFEAPLARIGEGFVGEMRNITLRSSA